MMEETYMVRDLTKIVIPPEQGEAWWQPQPAGGHIVIKTPTPSHMAMGTQEIAPGGRVPRHRHPAAEEILFVYQGQGRAWIDTEEVSLAPGTTLVIPPNTWHSFHNEGNAPLCLTWTISPAGLEGMFRTIGRPKQDGLPRPADWPAPSPEEVASFPQRFGIERAPK
jgi:quercetin dioxygenase-like cupin family protein